jgi:hypothetical protein
VCSSSCATTAPKLGATTLGDLQSLNQALRAAGVVTVTPLASVADFAAAVESWVASGNRRLLAAHPAARRGGCGHLALRLGPSLDDLPLGELGDRTPREALRSADGRARVEAAIARLGRLDDGRDAALVDVDALRDELGIA